VVVVVVVPDGGDDDDGDDGAQLLWKCRYYSSILASWAWVVCFSSYPCISFRAMPGQGCTGWERLRLWVLVGKMGLGPVPLPCNGMGQTMVTVQGCTGLEMVHGTGGLEVN
jgi:hypothetical protein